MRPHPHRTPPTITAVEPKKAHRRRSRPLPPADWKSSVKHGE
ncbi:hypothetical protein GFS60_03130 [Rhodococcus sp. WAY2]|nr:hypothetical protein GFS60_03130 [Rhodococcus sp. WAY2]